VRVAQPPPASTQTAKRACSGAQTQADHDTRVTYDHPRSLPNFSCQVEAAPYGDARIKWYRASQIRIAQQEFHYFANLSTYASWVRLRLNDFDAGTRHDIVICFHGMGRQFRGLIAGVAFYERAESREGDDRMIQAEQQVIQEDLFQLNHRETQATAEERFADWAEYVVAAGLAAWERGVTGA